jgi:hypothetical protein
MKRYKLKNKITPQNEKCNSFTEHSALDVPNANPRSRWG